MALVLDHLSAREPEAVDSLLERFDPAARRRIPPEIPAATALLGRTDREDADSSLLEAYGWRSHAVLATWLSESARQAAEQSWHLLHAHTRPPVSALLNLAELHRMRGEHGPARMLLGEAQTQVLTRPGERCGVSDRDYIPLIEALDQCNAGEEPDLELDLLTDRELFYLLDALDRPELRTDLWCTWRSAKRSLRVRLRGVFSDTWLGPLPGPQDPEELQDAAEVRKQLLADLKEETN